MRITKENLTRYDQHFKSWQRHRLGYGKALENWRQTEEGQVVPFWPVGGSSLEGKIKFIFKETAPAVGEKSPSNPSSISGASAINITRSGRNIALLSNWQGTHTQYGVTLNKNSDGSYTLNGQSTLASSNYAQWYNALTPAIRNIKLPEGTSFKLRTLVVSGSFERDPNRTVAVGLQAGTINLDGGYGYDSAYDGGSTSRNYSGKIYNSFTIQFYGAVKFNNYTFFPCAEFTDSEIETFEMPVFDNYTVNLGGTYYGGEIDLATGLMTVTHVMSEIDGSVVDGGLSASTDTFPIVVHIPESVLPPRTGYLIPSGCTCDKFPIANNTNDVEHIMLGQYYNYRQFRIYLSFSRCGITQGATTEERVAAAKTWLNNNHIKLVLNLREDYRHTVQLDPLALTALAQTSRHEPRLNTVYTDADSIQITYQKSPIRAATEQEMAILGLGGNV